MNKMQNWHRIGEESSELWAYWAEAVIVAFRLSKATTVPLSDEFGTWALCTVPFMFIGQPADLNETIEEFVDGLGASVAGPTHKDSVTVISVQSQPLTQIEGEYLVYGKVMFEADRESRDEAEYQSYMNDIARAHSRYCADMRSHSYHI